MSQTLDSPPQARVGQSPPYSRALQVAAGLCLALSGLTNGLSQYVGHLLSADGDFNDQIRWGAEHVALHRSEQVLLVVSTVFMPLGLLGIANVTRWTARRLTLVAVPLMLWGLWGFHNVLAMGFVAGTVTPHVLSVDDAVQLNDGLVSDPGVLLTALLPHLLGSFLGVLLISIAAWRSGAFPKVACALVAVFLVWDFLLPTSGVFEPHLLLFIGWTWLGIALIRMPHARWRGGAY